MKNYLLPTALFGTIALVSYLSPAVALSPMEIQQTARQTTVQIGRCSQGSGVIIQKNSNTYTVLTAAQAVRSSGCEIVTPDNNRYQISQVKVFPNNIDLAVVSFDTRQNYPVAIFGNAARIEAGEPVYISGFPNRAKSVFTLAQGKVVSNSSQPQGKHSLIYTSNTPSGRNGSPVWNDRGELVAIQGQGNPDPQPQLPRNYNIRVKTGYQLGTTTSTFTKFASAAGINGYPPITIAPNPKPVDDLITSAVLKESNDYRGMLADLNQAVFLDSQNARLYYLRGVAKSMLGNKDAIEDYNRAIALNLNESLVYNNRGVAKSAFGNPQGGIEDYNRAISLTPDRAETYYHRGNAKVALGNNRGGIEDYNRSISLDANLAQAYYGRSLVESKSGNKKGEIADLNRAVTIDPNYLEAHERLGLAKSKSGDFQGAIVSFSRAISLAPKNPETYDFRATARVKLGDNRGAIEDYSRVIAIDPNNAKAYHRRGSLKSKLGDKKGAILDLKKAANRFKLQRQTASYNRVITEIGRIGS
jgi:tetratricopeptide (TPR) repeat protein